MSTKDPIVTLPPLTRHNEPVSMDSIPWDLQPYEQIERFRELTDGGRGLVIYVGDTGFDIEHADLDGIDIKGYKVFVQTRFGNEDPNGHGTHVLSIIFRLLPNATYLLGKVLGDDGSGTSSGILRGNEWAAENGAMVMNESLGSNSPYQPKKDFLRGWDGILFAAAGNAGREGIGYPANYGAEVGVVPCGSHGPNWDGRSRHSSWGQRLLCLGPGERIVAAKSGGGRIPLTGTSMATPGCVGRVAGYMAGLWSAGLGDIKGMDAISKLISGIAHDLATPGRDRQTGFGYLDIESINNQLEKLDGGII